MAGGGSFVSFPALLLIVGRGAFWPFVPHTPETAPTEAVVSNRARRHIVDGDIVRIASAHGEIELPVIVTKDIVSGVVAVPHGWGHKGTAGWQVANGAGGANVNRLMSSAPEDIERLAGMARLTGVPIRIEAVAS